MKSVRTPLLALAFLLGSTLAWADDHAHHHGDAANKKPVVLKDGKKLGTDAPLREGMSKIRSLVAKDLPAAHDGKLSDKSYEKLGNEVSEWINYLFANCKLSPEADQVLHDEVLHDLLEGARIVKSDGKKVNGILQMLNGLDAYGKYFEHPGWKPIKH